ncbi:CotH kinase family protein [bacterium]|nr:CotH kinase family protein [bacterium]
MYKNFFRIIAIFISIILLLLLSITFFYRDIVISHNSGFYDKEFYLSIKTDKQSKIYYTLDCSKPTKESTQYTSPILIEDASKNPNIYSNRKDMSFNFYYDKKGQKTAANTVDKATIVRIAKYDKNNNFINETYRIYFVNFKNKNKKGEYNLPIVSIMMEPEDIVSEEKGIFVLGKKETTKSISCEKGKNENINFCQRGKDWQRKSFIDVFDERDRELLLTQSARIKIKGSESREWIQKSMSLYSEKEYSGSRYFKINPFRKNKKIHNIVLFNGGNDGYIKLREYLIQKTEERTNQHSFTIKMIPCIVFLNGEYWGVYYLSENANKDYFHTLYNIRKTNIEIAKKEINLKKETIDIDNFINYFATELYIANPDWPRHNVAVWRTLYEGSKNKYADKKWRFILYDINAMDTLKEYKYDSIGTAMNDSILFKTMMKDKEIREKLIKRLYFLENEVYTPEKMDKFIEEWLLVMKEPLYKNNERFFAVEPNILIEEKIQEIKTFFKLRPKYLNEHIKTHLLSEE